MELAGARERILPLVLSLPPGERPDKYEYNLLAINCSTSSRTDSKNFFNTRYCNLQADLLREPHVYVYIICENCSAHVKRFNFPIAIEKCLLSKTIVQGRCYYL